MVVGPTLALLVLGCLWLGFRAVTVVHELDAARAGAGELQSSLRAALTFGNTVRMAQVSTDGGSLAQRLSAVGRHTARARAATEDPVWRAASIVPYVGTNFAAVRAIADAGDAVARQALAVLDTSEATLRSAGRAPLRDGAPVAALQRLSASLSAADRIASSARGEVARSDAGQLLAPVGSARSRLLSQLSALHDTLAPLAQAFSLAPPMLGAATPRTYFVGFVNPAEARGGGGLLGGFAVVRADRGALTVERIGSDADLPNLTRGPAGLPVDFVDNYGLYGATTSWDETNLSAHFPYTGQLWAAMYTSLTGTHVDGVLSLDPAALAVLLRGAPPISVGAGARVTSANVVSFLQRDEYALPLSAVQRKNVLRTVARRAFSRLTAEPGSAMADVLPRLGSAAAAGHIRFWSAVPREQAVLARYAVAGEVPQGPAPFLSVFVNNAASGKLDSYLAVGTSYAVQSCPAARAPQGRREVKVSVTLENRAPAHGLPAYVTVRNDGAGADGRTSVPGANRSLVAVMLTDGAVVSSATLNGTELGSAPGGDTPYLTETTERGHPVESSFVELAPGARATLVLHVDEPASSAAPTLLRQPMAVPQGLRSTTGC